MLGHEIRVDFITEPVLSLHCVKYAVWDSVTHNYLQIAGIEIVELVFDFFVLDHAVVEVGTNVKEEIKVKYLVEYFGIGSQPIVHIEIA